MSQRRQVATAFERPGAQIAKPIDSLYGREIPERADGPWDGDIDDE